MTRQGFIIIFLLILVETAAGKVFGQNIDSLNRASTDNFITGDTVSTGNRLDSLLNKGKINRHTDSLRILTWGDSLRMKVNARYAKSHARLRHTPDSLEKISIASNRYKYKIDSLLNVTRPASKDYNILKSKRDSLSGIKLPVTSFTKKKERMTRKQQKC